MRPHDFYIVLGGHPHPIFKEMEGALLAITTHNPKYHNVSWMLCLANHRHWVPLLNHYTIVTSVVGLIHCEIFLSEKMRTVDLGNFFKQLMSFVLLVNLTNFWASVRSGIFGMALETMPSCFSPLEIVAGHTFFNFAISLTEVRFEFGLHVLQNLKG